MTASTVPPEILQQIFKNLYAFQVLECRLVCKSWNAAVEGLRDFEWHMICEKEGRYSVYKKVHDKASIPWRDTYVALNSWSNIQNSKMECSQLPDSGVKLFRILPNRVLAVLTTNPGSGDTIVYYNLDTLKELQRKTFEKTFRHFDENEHLLVLVSNKAEIILVQKAKDKQQVVGKVANHHDCYTGQFGLFGKKVYFQKEGGLIYISKFKETEKGESFIRTAPLKAFEKNYDSFEENVVTFGYMDDNMTFMTDEGNVYSYCDQDFGMLSKFRWHSGDIIEELNEYGFDWTSPFVYPWLLSAYKNNITIVKQKHESLLMHGPVVVVGGHNKPLIHIFSMLKPLYSKAKPVRTIDLSKLVTMKGNESVKQIEIVESTDYHRIIVLSDQRVFVLKFEYNPIGLESEADNRSEDGNSSEPAPTKRRAAAASKTTKSKAKKIIKKPTPMPKKTHRYNTRNAQK